MPNIPRCFAKICNINLQVQIHTSQYLKKLYTTEVSTNTVFEVTSNGLTASCFAVEFLETGVKHKEKFCDDEFYIFIPRGLNPLCIKLGAFPIGVPSSSRAT